MAASRVESTKEELIVRDARPEDAEAAAEIARQAWAPIRASFRKILGAEISAAFGDAAQAKYDQVQRFIRARPQDAVVSEINGKIVGFATTHLHAERNPDCPLGELGNNAVHPGHGGRGIGSRQERACLEKLLERGAKVLKVFTGLDEGHAPARRLYEKLGFERKLSHVEYYMSAREYLEKKRAP